MASHPARLSRARPLLIAAALAAATTVASCDETLESSLACPALCPQLAEPLRDTVLYAVSFDTSIGGFPPAGAESLLVLAAEPGTVDQRVVVRFDTLQATFRHKGSTVDSELVAIDAAFLKLRLAIADTLGPPVTLEVFDVDYDTTGVGTEGDTTAATLLPLFTGARALGTRTFAAESLKDSVSIPLDTAQVMAKVRATDRQRLRVGVRVSSTQRVRLAIHSGRSGFPPLLFMQPSTDTTVENISIAAYSRTPPRDPVRAVELADFQLVAQAPGAPPAGVIRVGGAPARRGYLRFSIPSEILDSSAVVRATLFLTQRPNASAPDATDSASVWPFELVASGAITDYRRALVFLAFSLDSVRMAPRDSGARAFEIIEAVRRWRFTDSTRTPRALALRATLEGLAAWQADFYSTAAPLAVRPRLRITYIPRLTAGLP